MSRKRSHIDPVAYHKRKSHLHRARRSDLACESDVGRYMMRALSKVLDNPRRAKRAAQRLLSEYTYAELGPALYMRCRRAIHGPGDAIRAKVVARGKPGVLNETERADYATRSAVAGIMDLLDG